MVPGARDPTAWLTPPGLGVSRFHGASRSRPNPPRKDCVRGIAGAGNVVCDTPVAGRARRTGRKLTRAIGRPAASELHVDIAEIRVHDGIRPALQSRNHQGLAGVVEPALAPRRARRGCCTARSCRDGHAATPRRRRWPRLTRPSRARSIPCSRRLHESRPAHVLAVVRIRGRSRASEYRFSDVSEIARSKAIVTERSSRTRELHGQRPEREQDRPCIHFMSLRLHTFMSIESATSTSAPSALCRLHRSPSMATPARVRRSTSRGAATPSGPTTGQTARAPECLLSLSVSLNLRDPSRR